MATTFVSCERESENDDDDYGPAITSQYTICDIDLIKDFDANNNGSALSIDEVPEALRTYLAAEFAGRQLKKVVSFIDKNGTPYLGAYLGNKNKVLLFDLAGTFVCGEEGL
ncbi:MAG TPA: hypothetical protein ENJ95_05260 [Bacteroidetes bacterium]|nr:hypothetical protein [Bacteroidota bacterium]